MDILFLDQTTLISAYQIKQALNSKEIAKQARIQFDLCPTFFDREFRAISYSVLFDKPSFAIP